MVCAPVRRDNPRALDRGLSTVQEHKPSSVLYHDIQCRPCTLRAKDWVSVDCGTVTFYIFIMVIISCISILILSFRYV